MTSNFGELPRELCSPLQVFVAVTGLDILHNAVHKAIWDLLSNNRQSDRVPIQFKVLEGDHEYPRAKPKRTSYDWYLPKGILKTNWMAKHLYKIPALVVLFFDLDWDEAQWEEKLIELCAKVQIVRAALEGRSSKVAVVLIQKNTPLPPGEDLVATDRATTLCAKCELSSRLLYVFPHTDHLFGYAIRLENALYELAQNYYQHQAKLVKGHREHLNKTTHHLLFVRHQFKIAFYNELKHDIPAALKNYKQAYANLVDIRVTDTNIAEVKMFSGFVSYKICKLSFYLNTPLDAISQFRKHIDIFKSRVGNPQLLFEHSAWIAKQFGVFGDLFEDSIRLGLSAIQTQHPGFYYQQAAIHAMTRKKYCRELCQNAFYPPSKPLSGMESMEYYGQRPWRPGVQSLEPPDINMERDGIRALQFKEMSDVNHSQIVIPLLSSAIAQFKKYRCPRMKRYLVVQMGEEYFDAKDYARALALLGHVIWDYRAERWWTLLTSVIVTAIKCAYLLANVQEYFSICMEVIGTNVCIPQAEKERVQRNLEAVLAKKIPEAEADLTDEAVKAGRELWEREILSDSSSNPFTVEMNHFACFVSCQAAFMSSTCLVDCPVTMSVLLKVSCPLPIRFSKLSVTFSNQIYNDYCVTYDTSVDQEAKESVGPVTDLYFEPGKSKTITFIFPPSPNDANLDIQITSIILQLGYGSSRRAIIHWKDNGVDGCSADEQWYRTPPAMRQDQDLIVEHIYPSIRILPRESHLKMTLHHDSPALENELYAIKIVLQNAEQSTADKVSLDIQFSESTHGASLLLEKPSSKDTVPINLTAKETLGSVGAGQQLEKVIYLKAVTDGSCSILIKVTYHVLLTVNGENLEYECSCEQELSVPVVQPFTVTARALSTRLEALEVLWTEESFLFNIEIQSTSPWPLIFKGSRLQLNDVLTDGFSSQVENVVINSGDIASEAHLLKLPAVEDGSLALGQYYLSWRRQGASLPASWTTTSITLPVMSAIRIPISVSLNLPTHGWVRTPLTIAYSVRNRTAQVQQFDFCMDTSDSFMYAGHKQVHFKILPESSLTLKYNLYPLVCGYVSLPKLRMLTHDSLYDSQMEAIVQKMLPSHIFIMPQAKHWSTDGEVKTSIPLNVSM